MSNLGPLAGLAQLSTLTLEHCQVSDISPLAGLARLTTLHLSGADRVMRASRRHLKAALPQLTIAR